MYATTGFLDSKPSLGNVEYSVRPILNKKEIITDERLSVSFSSLKNYISIKTDVGERIGKMGVTDLNGDGIHDWHDLTIEKEEIWKLG